MVTWRLFLQGKFIKTISFYYSMSPRIILIDLKIRDLERRKEEVGILKHAASQSGCSKFYPLIIVIANTRIISWWTAHPHAMLVNCQICGYSRYIVIITYILQTPYIWHQSPIPLSHQTIGRSQFCCNSAEKEVLQDINYCIIQVYLF